ncbi:arylsulfatase B-like isoform X3 [Haemaphysalis longicornis]
MSRFCVIFAILVVAGILGSLVAYVIYTFVKAEPQARPPHIIFILADDLGWADVSFHGSSQIPTPNLDALAADGIILNNYYTHPTCTASRGALMTGFYSTRYGLQHRPIQPGQPYGLDLNYTLLPQHLKRLGYETHLIGKWHLGCYREEFTPTRRGFDSFYGLHYGHVDYYDHQLLSDENASITGLDFWNGTAPAVDAYGHYSTDLFAEQAVRLIKTLDKSKPQFLYLSHQAVHSGNYDNHLQAPRRNIDKFPYIVEENRTIYAGMLDSLDEAVGRTVHALGGAVSDLGQLDGQDMWNVLSNDEPSPRSTMVYNIDPMWGYAAVRHGRYKIVVGQQKDGVLERIPIPGNPRPQQDLDALTEQSMSAQTLRTFYGTESLGFAPNWRLNATVMCAEECCADDTNFQSPDYVFLFDLYNDPCECNNLASTHKELLEYLNNTLEGFRAETVFPLNPPTDPASYPGNHNGTWAPWID